MSRDYGAARDMDDIYGDDEALEIGFRKFVHELSGTTDESDVGPMEATFRALDKIGDLQERVDELEQENQDLRARLDRLGDIGEEKTSKEQKIAAIVTYADNQRRSGQSRITILPKEIQGVTDVSERYSYTLVDDMVGGEGEDELDGYNWALDPQRQARRPDQDKPQKGVLIDFEQLHADPEALNKFINGTDAEGVAG